MHQPGPAGTPCHLHTLGFVGPRTIFFLFFSPIFGIRKRAYNPPQQLLRRAQRQVQRTLMPLQYTRPWTWPQVPGSLGAVLLYLRLCLRCSQCPPHNVNLLTRPLPAAESSPPACTSPNLVSVAHASFVSPQESLHPGHCRVSPGSHGIGRCPQTDQKVSLHILFPPLSHVAVSRGFEGPVCAYFACFPHKAGRNACP